MAFSHKTIVMMHLEKRFHLRHGIEIDTNEDEQRSAAQQIRQLAREIKEPLRPVGLPKAAPASERVVCTACSSAASVCTTRMPRPPPPPAALMITG